MRPFSTTQFRYAISLFTILVTLCLSELARGRQFIRFDDALPLEIQIEGKPEENFRYMAAQCWLPETVPIKAILCIVLHPDGSNARTLACSREWRELAHSYGAALLAISIVPSENTTRPWCDASGGSGDALVSAINKIAQISKRTQILNAPLLVAGVCAAGQFSYEFAAFKSDRTIGFITIGGAKHRMEMASSAARTQGLLVVTPDRGEEATSNLETLAILGRMYDAPWIEAEEKISDYDSGSVSPEVITFIEMILGNQLPEKRLAWPQSHIPRQLSPSLPMFRETPSFLGKPLKISATAEAFQVPNETSRFVIRVRANHPADFDSVAVPKGVPGRSSISRTAENEWEIFLTVNNEDVPFGTFRFEVPIRFAHAGIPLLGGLQVPVKGTLQDDIYPHPSSVRITWTATERESRLTLLSRAKLDIVQVEIEQVVPDWISARLVDGCSSQILIFPQTGTPSLPNTVSGYLILRANSNKKQRIKVPFYGTISS